MQGIISKLEERVDPFDLDVFTPYMQSNLSKLAQRSSVSRNFNDQIQSNFNGSNTFGTMKISSRQG